MDIKVVMSLGRFKDIVKILIKYGFDDVVERLEPPGMKFLKRINKLYPGLETY